jgi:predicted enzyme related to lactoylglutathione lyase
MASNRVIHLEIPANAPQALTRFYGDLFGWSFARSANAEIEYWTCSTGAKGTGPDVGIAKKQHAQHPCISYVEVDDLDVAIAKASRLGAQVAVPRKPIPNVGAIACLVDPEGNVFGLMELAKA